MSSTAPRPAASGSRGCARAPRLGAPQLGEIQLAVEPGAYAITTAEGQAQFSIARATDGSRALTCRPPGTGGCPPSGIWR